MSVAQVRTLTADNYQYDRATATGDGSTTEFELPQKPVLSESDTVTLDAAAQSRDTDYTIDLAVGLVTFTDAPDNGAALVFTYKHSLLSDGDITTMLTLSSSNVREAAALALDAIASNEALVQKRMRIMDITTDGPAVAKSLREHAEKLRAEAADFDYAEMVFDKFTYQEKLTKDALRSS